MGARDQPVSSIQQEWATTVNGALPVQCSDCNARRTSLTRMRTGARNGVNVDDLQVRANYTCGKIARADFADEVITDAWVVFVETPCSR